MSPGTECLVLYDTPPKDRRGQSVIIEGPLEEGPFVGANGERYPGPMYPVATEDGERGCFYPPAWLMPMPPKSRPVETLVRDLPHFEVVK